MPKDNRGGKRAGVNQSKGVLQMDPDTKYISRSQAVERLQAIVANSTQPDGYRLTVKANDWEKGGRSRTYLSIIETRENSSHRKEKRYGYIDNNSGEYFPEKYGDIRLNFNFSGSKF